MAQKSSIEMLPEDLQKALHRLLRKPQTTIDEATSYINELTRAMGARISRSAMGRYKKRIDAEGARLKQTRVIAEAVVQEYGEDNKNAVGRLLLEKLRVLVFDMFELFDEGSAMDTKQRVKAIKTMSETLHHIEVAASTSVEREKKMRKVLADEAKEKLRKSSADAETKKKVKELLETVYGIRQ